MSCEKPGGKLPQTQTRTTWATPVDRHHRLRFDIRPTVISCPGALTTVDLVLLEQGLCKCAFHFAHASSLHCKPFLLSQVPPTTRQRDHPIGPMQNGSPLNVRIVRATFQAFAARCCQYFFRAMDFAKVYLIHIHGSVNGRVRGQAKDHNNFIASSRVGCPFVPPACCVDNAPHTQARRKDFSNSQPFR